MTASNQFMSASKLQKNKTVLKWNRPLPTYWLPEYVFQNSGTLKQLSIWTSQHLCSPRIYVELPCQKSFELRLSFHISTRLSLVSQPSRRRGQTSSCVREPIGNRLGHFKVFFPHIDIFFLQFFHRRVVRTESWNRTRKQSRVSKSMNANANYHCKVEQQDKEHYPPTSSTKAQKIHFATFNNFLLMAAFFLPYYPIQHHPLTILVKNYLEDGCLSWSNLSARQKSNPQLINFSSDRPTV